MTKTELLQYLEEIYCVGDDKEEDHKKADKLLLRYINSPRVTKAFNKIDKWYA